MLLTSNYPNVPLHTGNPAMDMARRDNLRREVIEPVAAMERSAAEKGLITDVSVWFGYRQMRNITAHTYDHQKAQQVYEGTQAFMLDARLLLARLEDAID